MHSDEEPGFARGIRDAYLRTPSDDGAARERLLERLRHAPPPRARSWRRWIPDAFEGPQVRSALAAAGVLVLVGGALVARLERPAPSLAPPTPAGVERPVVRFELDAPGAARVALVGDFNDWDPAATPMRRDASRDTWSVSVPVTRGRHVYGFVVDHRRWMPDPAAPLAPEDGFGSHSSVIVVPGAEP